MKLSSSDLDRDELTPRELEVACLIAEGRTYGDIGARLNISNRTVETYAYNISKRIEGTAPPRERIMLWFHGIDQAVDAS